MLIKYFVTDNDKNINTKTQVLPSCPNRGHTPSSSTSPTSSPLSPLVCPVIHAAMQSSLLCSQNCRDPHIRFPFLFLTIQVIMCYVVIVFMHMAVILSNHSLATVTHTAGLSNLGSLHMPVCCAWGCSKRDRLVCKEFGECGLFSKTKKQKTKV